MRPLVVALFVCAAVPLAPRVAEAGDNYVYLRTNPVAFAVHGTPMFPKPGGGKAGWYPDMFGLGFNYEKLDVAFNMTAQNPFPDTGEFSVLFGRLSAALRPLKQGPISVVDPYIFGGVGFGGAGTYGKQDPACTSTPTDVCAEARDSWGGGLHAGVGVDFNITLGRIASSGQRISAFVGLEMRGELFFEKVNKANIFTVYSLPIGIRLD